MQFVSQENCDEIHHLLWSWVLPLEKKTKWDECKIEIKRELTLHLRLNFYFVLKMKMQETNNVIKIKLLMKTQYQSVLNLLVILFK